MLIHTSDTQVSKKKLGKYFFFIFDYFLSYVCSTFICNFQDIFWKWFQKLLEFYFMVINLETKKYLKFFS